MSAATAKSLQSCLTVYDPIDGSPPGSPVPGHFWFGLLLLPPNSSPSACLHFSLGSSHPFSSVLSIPEV